MSRFAGLILAAGKGTRMQQEIPKQFIEINGKPLFLYSVEVFLPLMDEVAVVTGKDQISTALGYLEKAGLSDHVKVLAGGRERFDSSFLGIDYLYREKRADYVLIHDAARCMIQPEIIRRCMADVTEFKASVCAIPAQDTVKISDEEGFAVKTLHRKELRTVQTPQAFELSLIHRAYEDFFKNPDADVTDDAGIVEKYTSQKVKFTLGAPSNMKVTTPYDLFIAKAFFSLTNENETIII